MLGLHRWREDGLEKPVHQHGILLVAVALKPVWVFAGLKGTVQRPGQVQPPHELTHVRLALLHDETRTFEAREVVADRFWKEFPNGFPRRHDVRGDFREDIASSYPEHHLGVQELILFWEKRLVLHIVRASALARVHEEKFWVFGKAERIPRLTGVEVRQAPL